MERNYSESFSSSKFVFRTFSDMFFLTIPLGPAGLGQVMIMMTMMIMITIVIMMTIVMITNGVDLW